MFIAINLWRAYRTLDIQADDAPSGESRLSGSFFTVYVNVVAFEDSFGLQCAPQAGHSRRRSSPSYSSTSSQSPNRKKRRKSMSGMSGTSDNSDAEQHPDSSDEDKPLAASRSVKTRPGAGKGLPTALGVAHIVPRGEDGSRSAPNLKIKIEDVKLDHTQIDRLTSGVTVDVTSAAEEVILVALVVD